MSLQPHTSSLFRLSIRQVLYGFVLMGLAFWSFSSSCVVGGDCVYDTDCQPNELCTDRRCHRFSADASKTAQACRFDSDCPGQLLCNAGLCQAGTVIFENKQYEPPPTPDVGGNGPEKTLQESVQPVESGPNDSSSKESSPDTGPPPPPGKPPIQQSSAAGAMVSSTSKYRHMAVVGQLTPLVPKATVMRSGNYSMRPGIVAVTMW